MSIAIVDLQDAGAGDAFVRALHDTGFAVVRHAAMDIGRLRRMDAAWRSFFSAPLAEKNAWLALEDPRSGNSAGYIPASVSETAVGHAVKDLKEFFHISPGGPLPPAMAEDTAAHLEEALALGRKLLGWIEARCAGDLPPELRGRLAESLSAQYSLLRMIHYPPLDGSEAAGAVRAAAHEDINMLTVLPVSREAGLQVLSRDGQWLDVPGEPGDVIINVGDMLQEASSGALPSTTHRVVNPVDAGANVSRIAMPYFLAPDLELRLSERYTAGEYLRERLELIAR